MTEILSTLSTILIAAIGIALLVIGAFLYEDQEQQIQSKLEECWVYLDDHRVTAFAHESAILPRWMAASLKLSDLILGPRIFSPRAILATIQLSAMGVWTSGVFITFRQGRLWWAFTYVIALLLTAEALYFNRKSSKQSLFFFLCSLTSVVYPFMRGLPEYLGIHGEDVVYLWVCGWILPFLLSTATDMVLLATLRYLFRKNTSNVSKLRPYCTLVGVVTVFFASWYAPLWLGDFIGEAGVVAGDGAGPMFGYWLTQQVLYNAAFLNAVDAIVLGVVATALVALAAHHLLWRMVMHPLYSFQRFGLLENKRRICLAGATLIAVALPHGTFAFFWATLQKALLE
jgi:hypothetical protein